MEIDYDYYIKIIMIGDVKTGKTNLVSNICGNSFDEVHIPTIGLDFRIKNIEIERESKHINFRNNEKTKIRLQIIDSSGSERFAGILKNFSKKTDAIIFVYDITNQNSLQNVGKWISLLTNYKFNINDNIIRILIGNKTDLEENRKINFKEGKEFADKYNMFHYEVSAKDENTGKIILEDICKKIIDNLISIEESNGNKYSDDVNLLSGKKNKNNCCSLL